MKWQRLLYTFAVIVFANGCSQQQWVRQPYPIWGKVVQLPRESQSYPLHLQLLTTPAMKLKGCMLMVHGMNEYIGRYGYLAKHFADRFIVAGVDLTAHGLSNSTLNKAHNSILAGSEKYDVSDAFIEQAQLGSLEPMRDDFHQALKFLVAHCNKLTGDDSLPVFILTHSLGSLVSASYLLRASEESVLSRVKGIIFSGPAFSVTQVPGWRGWLQNPFIIFSFHTHKHFLNPQDEPFPILLFNQVLSLVTVPLQDLIINFLSLPGARNLFSPSTPDWVVEYLSNWEDERKRHQADNYIIRRTILRYVLAVEKEIILFRKQMKNFNIPYLLIYSEYDPITPAWGNTDFSAKTLNKHKHNKLMRLNGENHHEQFFSTPELREKILRKMDIWLQLRLEQERG